MSNSHRQKILWEHLPYFLFHMTPHVLLWMTIIWPRYSESVISSAFWILKTIDSSIIKRKYHSWYIPFQPNQTGPDRKVHLIIRWEHLLPVWLTIGNFRGILNSDLSRSNMSQIMFNESFKSYFGGWTFSTEFNWISFTRCVHEIRTKNNLTFV